MKQLILIHGWNDEPESFARLGQQVAGTLGMEFTEIWLGDWMSMHDEVTLADVAVALERAWHKLAISTEPRSVGLIVHSTGGLVVREWMTRYYRPQTVPIHHLLMLAPANFGSPLAHKGHSFFARAFFGFKTGSFQTGKRILKSLELGSPYTYALAHRDLLDAENRWYGPGRILCTVLIGNKGYTGVKAIANKEGSDGTVCASTANLNITKIMLHLDEENNPIPLKNAAGDLVPFTVQHSNGEIGFGIVADQDHSSLKGAKDKGDPALPLITAALNRTDGNWAEWLAQLAEQTQQTGAAAQYQNTVIHLSDHLGHAVTDYNLAFYRTEQQDDAFEQRLYGERESKLLASAHAYEDDKSYRALYLNIAHFYKLRADIEAKGGLYFSFEATPAYLKDNPKQLRRHPAGYLSKREYDKDGLKIPNTALDVVFAPHRTLLVEAQIHRHVDDSVYTMQTVDAFLAKKPKDTL